MQDTHARLAPREARACEGLHLGLSLASPSFVSLQDDEHQVVALGIEFGTQLCKDLIAVGVPGLHLYTLNLELVTNGILQNLGYFLQ